MITLMEPWPITLLNKFRIILPSRLGEFVVSLSHARFVTSLLVSKGSKLMLRLRVKTGTLPPPKLDWTFVENCDQSQSFWVTVLLPVRSSSSHLSHLSFLVDCSRLVLYWFAVMEGESHVTFLQKPDDGEYHITMPNMFVPSPVITPSLLLLILLSLGMHEASSLAR